MISVLYGGHEWDAVMSNDGYFESSGWPDSVFTLTNRSTNSSVWTFGLVLTGLCGLTPGFCCVDAALACEFVTSLCVSFGTTLHLLYQHSPRLINDTQLTQQNKTQCLPNNYIDKYSFIYIPCQGCILSCHTASVLSANLFSVEVKNQFKISKLYEHLTLTRLISQRMMRGLLSKKSGWPVVSSKENKTHIE